MKKQLPEKKQTAAEAGLEEQAQKLRELALNEHFRKIRGRCDESFIGVFNSLKIDEKGKPMAPSRYAQEVKDFCASLPLIFNKLAQLERDGCHIAVDEVELALRQLDYRMLGESDRQEKLTAFTLVIFEAGATMPYIFGLSHTTRRPLSEYQVDLSKAPEQLKAKFPPKKFRRELLEPENLPVVNMNSYSSWLWEITEPLLTKLQLFGRKKYHDDKLQAFRRASIYAFDKDYKYANWDKGLAYLFRAEQKDVLRTFSRKEQEQIATWQFYLPALPRKYGRDYSCIGLHPESEHSYWQNLRGTFCSKGLNWGYGALAYPGEAYNCFDRKFETHKNMRIVLSND